MASAVEMALSTTSRAWKPYPPGNVMINGLDYEHWPANTTGDVALSWTFRNRTVQGQGGVLVPQDSIATFPLEGTIQVEALIGGISKRSWTGLTSTGLTYTAAQRAADDPDMTRTVQFRITPMNGSRSGTVRTTPAFLMSA